jgi:hypothetical protein
MQRIRLMDEYQQRVWWLPDEELRLLEVGICMYGRYSILDLMKWSHLAREAGIITDAEWCEANRLGNRLAFATDRRCPALITPAERARFTALAKLIFPTRVERPGMSAAKPRRTTTSTMIRASRHRIAREPVLR